MVLADDEQSADGRFRAGLGPESRGHGVGRRGGGHPGGALRATPCRADVLASSGDSTGDACCRARVTPLATGPLSGPRLRGLDSTEVDPRRGETSKARTATDRAGAEVGLVDPDSSKRWGAWGAGPVLYGTDALSARSTHQKPGAALGRHCSRGSRRNYSSNENGRRAR